MLLRLLTVVVFVSGCASVPAARPASISPIGSGPPESAIRGLRPFESLEALEHLAAAAASRRTETRRLEEAEARARCEADAKASGYPLAHCSASLSETVTVAAEAGRGESITNTQHEGVDEGGIVKRSGDLLIVLRHGHLFTIDLAGDRLRPAAMVAAGGIAPAGDGETWYDELLVWRHTVVVVGYSYRRGGTEIGLFALSDDGRLRHKATYHLRSADYYSGTNYASRLIGSRLFFFTSYALPDDTRASAWLPALRRWRTGATKADFATTSSIDRVFSSVRQSRRAPTVHVLTSCDLAAPTFACSATVVLGQPLREFYASPSAVYAWTRDFDARGTATPGVLIRLPYDDAPVTAVGVEGEPIDQFSFFEAAEGTLFVVTRQADDGTALATIPRAAFGAGDNDLAANAYRDVGHDLGPRPISRFVGRHVVMGTSWSEDDGHQARVVVAALDGSSVHDLPLNHEVERIEVMGSGAVVVGSRTGALGMTTLRLAPTPAAQGVLFLPDAEQAERRSHGFFYRPDGEDAGVFGIPITAYSYDGRQEHTSGRVVFVRQEHMRLTDAGVLASGDDPGIDDACEVSCVDWYGNARPIFIRDRVFALLGYEIVEGRMSGGAIVETRRVDFIAKFIR